MVPLLLTVLIPCFLDNRSVETRLVPDDQFSSLTSLVGEEQIIEVKEDKKEVKGDKKDTDQPTPFPHELYDEYMEKKGRLWD